MPSYAYRCNNCKRGDEWKGASDQRPDNLGTCSCGGLLVRVFAPVAVHFKGTGFYSTGNK